MPNPISYASGSFWDTSQNIDKILRDLDSPIKPITDQLRRVAEIDTDELVRVAEEGWGIAPDGNGDQDGALTARLNQAIEMAMDARERALESWDGISSEEFRSTLESFRDSMQNLQGPAAQVGQALKNIKEKVDQSIFDVMSQIGSVAGIVGGLAAFTGGLAAAPEPIVTKVLAIVGGVVTLIVSIITFVTTVVKAEYEKFQSVDAAFNSAIEMQRSLPN